jgi:hypothetical protein
MIPFFFFLQKIKFLKLSSSWIARFCRSKFSLLLFVLLGNVAFAQYQSDDGGYQSDDGGYQSDDGGYQSDDGGYQSDDGGYQSDDGGYQSDDGGYQSDDGGYQSDDGGYQSDDGGYQTDDGGYQTDDGGYQTDDGGYQSDDGGYQSDDGGYQSDDGGYQSDDGGYQSDDGGYQSDDGGYQSDDGGYQSDDGGYQSDDGGYQSDDGGYQSGDGGELPVFELNSTHITYMAENVNILYEGNYTFEEVEVINGQNEIRFSLTAFVDGQWEVSSSLYYVVDPQVLPNQDAIDSYLVSQNLTPVDGGSQSDDGGYQSDDGGYQTDDGGYQSDDGGYQSDDGGYQSDDGGYQSDDGGYQSDDGGYQSDDGGYQSDDGGYQSDDGGYQSDDGGYQSDDGGYQSDDGGYQSDDGGYQSDDGGYQSDDGGYQSDDGGYQSDDGGYQSDDGGYQTDDGGYQSDDGGYQTDDGGSLSETAVKTYSNIPATVMGQVTIDGEPADDGDIVGAYVGGELRGKQVVTINDGTAWLNMQVHAAGGEETATFKVYDASTGVTLDNIELSVVIQPEGAVGSYAEPLLIQFVGYQSDDGGYQTDDGGYQSDDGGYQTDDGGYHTDDGGYHTDDGGYQSDDGGYHTDDGGYHTDDGGYQTDDGGFHTDDGGYHTDDGGYHTDDGGYHTDDGGYQTDDGGYHTDDGGYQTDDGGYHTDDGGYQTDDGGYHTDDGGYQTDDGGYHTDDGGYQTDDGGYHTDDGGYHTDDGGYQTDDGGYHTDDGGYHTDDGGYQTDDGGYHTDGGNHSDPDDGNFTGPGEGNADGGSEGSDGEHNATIDLNEPVAVLDLGDHEKLAEFASDYGTIYFQYFDANVSGDFGPGDPWVLSIEEGTGALESVVVDMVGLVFAGNFVAYWEQALDVSPKDEKWNEADYNATAEGISSLYEDHPFLHEWNGGNHSDPNDGNFTGPGEGNADGGSEGSDDEHNATIDLNEPVAVLDLGDHEELAEFASDYGTIYFQYFDANVSGDFGPGDPWVLSIEEGTGALESVVVDMVGLVFAGNFVAYWEQALDVSPKDEKWNEADYNATAEGISSLYEDYPFLQDWISDENEGENEFEPGSAEGEDDEHEEFEPGSAEGEGDEHEEFEPDPAEGEDDEHEEFEPDPAAGEGDEHEEFEPDPAVGEGDEHEGFEPDPAGSDDETDGEHEEATIDLSEPVGVLDLGNQEKVTNFASDFGMVFFQYYDKDESGDFGPGDSWTISIEEGTGAHENVVVDMDGLVFAGDFEAYWQQVMDISIQDDVWYEKGYEGTSEEIVSLYEDYPFLQDWSADENEGKNEVEPKPGPAEGDEHQLAIAKTTDSDLLDDGLVRLSGSLLYDGDAPDTETGFVISNSLFLGDNEFESAPADGDADEHEVRVIAIDDNDDGDFSFDFAPSLSGATYYYRSFAENEAGVSYGAPRKFVSEHFDDSSHDKEVDDLGEGRRVDDDDPWADATSLEGGWLDVPWFGALLTFDDNDWIFHDGLGWLFSMPDGEGGVWLWQEERGWLWTKSGLWPYLYQHDHAEWIYFLGNRQGRALFYNYSTNSAE